MSRAPARGAVAFSAAKQPRLTARSAAAASVNAMRPASPLDLFEFISGSCIQGGVVYPQRRTTASAPLVRAAQIFRISVRHRRQTMDLGLKGKVAVVTGGTEGIGRASAIKFAQDGAHVANSARREKLLEAAAAEIRRHGVE